MRCANLSDDQLWRLIAENTEKLSTLIRQQIEFDDAEYSAITTRKGGLHPFRK
jgi:hypothetical protein